MVSLIVSGLENRERTLCKMIKNLMRLPGDNWPIAEPREDMFYLSGADHEGSKRRAGYKKLCPKMIAR